MEIVGAVIHLQKKVMEIPQDLKDADAMFVVAFKRDTKNPKQGFLGMHMLFDEALDIKTLEQVDDIKSHILTGVASVVEQDFHNQGSGGEFMMVITKLLAERFPEIILNDDAFAILKAFKNVSDAIDQSPDCDKIQDPIGEFAYEDGRSYQIQMVASKQDFDKIEPNKIKIIRYE